MFGEVDSAELYQKMRRFFDEDEWFFEEDIENNALVSRFRGENGVWACLARVQGPLVVFYSLLEVHVPEERRDAMAEFITRANYGLPFGAFEMDYSDGEVRLRTGFFTADIDFTTTHMRNIVYANLLTMDRYLPGIMRVIYGREDPKAVVEEIEREQGD